MPESSVSACPGPSPLGAPLGASEGTRPLQPLGLNMHVSKDNNFWSRAQGVSRGPLLKEAQVLRMSLRKGGGRIMRMGVGGFFSQLWKGKISSVFQLGQNDTIKNSDLGF